LSAPPPESAAQKRRASPATAVILAVIALLALGAIWFAWMPQASHSSLIGGPFALEDGAGKTVSDQTLKGKPFLVCFGYTHCPDVCPTELARVSDVLAKMGDKAIPALFITVDPERDTPDLVKTYAGNFDPRIIGLSGDRAAIDRVLAEYRVYARKAPGANGDYTMDHSAVIYLMDRDGKFLRAFNMERPPEKAAAELRALL